MTPVLTRALTVVPLAGAAGTGATCASRRAETTVVDEQLRMKTAAIIIIIISEETLGAMMPERQRERAARLCFYQGEDERD